MTYVDAIPRDAEGSLTAYQQAQKQEVMRRGTPQTYLQLTNHEMFVISCVALSGKRHHQHPAPPRVEKAWTTTRRSNYWHPRPRPCVVCVGSKVHPLFVAGVDLPKRSTNARINNSHVFDMQSALDAQ